MKIISVFGTRPEIIRLSRIFPLLDSNFQHVMINTNQNFTPELNSVFFSELGIRKPDYNLKIKLGTFGLEVAEIILKTEKIILAEKPDVMLILGDTHSGLASIIGAHYGIKIVHLEAGMRAYDFRMPEDKNRILIDHLSSILLPYTNYSRENLIRENIHPSKIYVTGNPIFEVLDYYSSKIEKSQILDKMKLKKNQYVLVTAHRSENVDNDENLKQIFDSLENIHKKFKKRIIYPIHPRTLNKTRKIKIPKFIEIINPLGFFDFIKLEKNAFCLITDSGTIPEESFYFKIPCVTIRETTERPEFIETGYNILSGLEPEKIINSVKTITSRDIMTNQSFEIPKTSSIVLNILSGNFNRIKFLE